MKVIHMALMRSMPDVEKPVILCHGANLESFGFFQRNGVREMLTTFSRIIVQRIRPGQRITVEQEQMNEYQVHVHVRADGLAGVITADLEYPARVAFGLLAQLMDDFVNAAPGWEKETRDDAIAFPPIADAIVRCQDPANFDKIVKIQRDLDDTTAVLHKTIDNILERGEKLDQLVERSDDLSAQSKLFYKQARKTNSCCVIS